MPLFTDRVSSRPFEEIEQYPHLDRPPDLSQTGVYARGRGPFPPCTRHAYSLSTHLSSSLVTQESNLSEVLIRPCPPPTWDSWLALELSRLSSMRSDIPPRSLDYISVIEYLSIIWMREATPRNFTPLFRDYLSQNIRNLIEKNATRIKMWLQFEPFSLVHYTSRSPESTAFQRHTPLDERGQRHLASFGTYPLQYVENFFMIEFSNQVRRWAEEWIAGNLPQLFSTFQDPHLMLSGGALKSLLLGHLLVPHSRPLYELFSLLLIDLPPNSPLKTLLNTVTRCSETLHQYLQCRSTAHATILEGRE